MESTAAEGMVVETGVTEKDEEEDSGCAFTEKPLEGPW